MNRRDFFKGATAATAVTAPSWALARVLKDGFQEQEEM